MEELEYLNEKLFRIKSLFGAMKRKMNKNKL
jgi:hypothetical protein